MKYIILLLFPTLLFAAFTPFTGNPPADSITATGNLLTKNATVQTNFAACPDGEFLIWDSAEDTGMICSGSTFTYDGTGVRFGDTMIIGGSTELGIHGSGNRNSFVDFHSSDGVDYNTRIIREPGVDGGLHIANTGNSVIAFSTNSAVRLRIQPAGGITIYDTGGNGGNVPHQCAYTATNSNVAAINYYCPDVTDIVVAGGCSTADASETLIASHPTSNMNGWSCQSQAGSSTDLYVRMICCQY